MRLQRNRYSEEFKEQIARECQQVGNTAVVARRHEISAKTAANWVRGAKARGSAGPLPKDKDGRLKELDRRLGTVSAENDKLKRLVAKKELELAILRELRALSNPR
jgi:transposase-like protein